MPSAPFQSHRARNPSSGRSSTRHARELATAFKNNDVDTLIRCLADVDPAHLDAPTIWQAAIASESHHPRLLERLPPIAAGLATAELRNQFVWKLTRNGYGVTLDWLTRQHGMDEALDASRPKAMEAVAAALDLCESGAVGFWVDRSPSRRARQAESVAGVSVRHRAKLN